jgi:anti-sigma factor RsiW
VDCKETQKLIDPYGDGELDSLRSREVEGHLESCAICAQAYRNHRELKAALSTGALYFKAPPRVHKQVQSAVREVAQAETKRAMPGRHVVLRRWGSLAAAMAVLALLLWRFTPRPASPDIDEVLSREMVASHVRSLMAHHLTDIVSSDTQVVKPWFTGKLKYSPEVKNLEKQGFVLVGARLDYVAKEPVAALVYKHGSSFINLFVCPASIGGEAEDEDEDAEEEGTELIRQQGYNVLYWAKEDLTYWAVSDLDKNAMERFAQAARHEA